MLCSAERCAADPESILVSVDIGPGSAEQREGALHRVRGASGICSRRRVVICPSGSLLTGVSSPICKNIPVFTHPKSHLELWPSHPTRGAYRGRHGRWAGCGGRGSVLRAMGSQGG